MVHIPAELLSTGLDARDSVPSPDPREERDLGDCVSVCVCVCVCVCVLRHMCGF